MNGKATVIQAIAESATARDNCDLTGNKEWGDRWAARIVELMQQAPSGCGFDTGTRLISITPTRVIFETSFHHLDENGSYDGWTDHTVTARARFDGIGIDVSGPNKNEIKDYIADVFREWLTGNEGESDVLAAKGVLA